MRKLIQNTCISIILLLVSGCGFHLRGQQSIPHYMEKTYVEGDNAELVAKLNLELRSRGVEAIKEQSDATIILDLLRVTYLREVRSIDNRGKVNGYISKYEVEYRVLMPNLDILLDKTLITLSSSLEYDSGQVLELELEEELLRDELLNQLAKRIAQRLEVLAEGLIG
ncbi:MAG: hypothetical protein CL402_03550 [Acidiferrobacteraceae bacterium]|nr:hypothetical protein [Acidiferrobacteraceae bacterium]